MESQSEAIVKGIIRRLVGDEAARFEFKIEPSSERADWFHVQSRRGEIQIAASSSVAAARAAYTYLKVGCQAQVNWSGQHLPRPLCHPQVFEVEVRARTRYRHYYNMCTCSYSTAFWDWPRWERELDWMALHGINMPLSLAGQDVVWRRLWRSYRLPEQSISNFLCGPAFQSFRIGGNLNGHGGPPPESWIEGQAELQKKILKRQLELGMTPVVSGFSGFVPVDFDEYVRGAKVTTGPGWNGFEPTRFVDVQEPLFAEIGSRYIHEYRREYGEGIHHYLCDTFNELDPQYPDSTKYGDLRNAGKAVIEGITQGDPDGIWVMQGWMFYYARNYWGKPEVEALLDALPAGRVIVLDLATYECPVWKEHPSMTAKGWITNTLHNYGQNTALYGNLRGYAEAIEDAVTSPDRGNLVGTGLTMEGIDQNPVLYELMADRMWSPVEPSVESWLMDYANQRVTWNSDATNAHRDAYRRAWEGIHETIYGEFEYKSPRWRMRPSADASAPSPSLVRSARQIVADLLIALEGVDLSQGDLWERDLVDFTKHWLSLVADSVLPAAIKGIHDAREAFFDALERMDQILSCRSEHRLSTWLDAARTWGATEAEKNLMEYGARMQVTTWDRKGILNDYAGKDWSGLIAEFYIPRWRFYFAACDRGETPDMQKWELDWTSNAVLSRID
ncbi:MAG: alpha-N-acetylglucosaminidase C-terminal domain-containing protein [Armatimonadetes bacterium]|nr:alpha-N-acetylglucosaminidase C-terminal domain-containing protein [Armatimonadota bacterium]